MKRLFDRLATEREQFGEQLIDKLGTAPRAHGSFTAALHRSWLDIKDKLGAMSQAELLRECARGEAAAIKQYQDALTKHAPTDVQAVMTTQLGRLLETHARLVELAANFE